MALKTYTVTVNGASNGNVISQPFTIELHQLSYVSDGTLDAEGNPITYMAVSSCTKNGGGNDCANDDIANYNQFALPAMTSSKNADLAATDSFEDLLDAAYGVGNWS